MAQAPEPSNKRYVCPECDKAFSTSSHLGRHARVHTGEKSYKCDYPGCETRCSRADNLQAHKRVHSSSQPRPRGKKSRGARSAGSSDSYPSPGSSSSSSSRFSSVSASSSPQSFMSPQLLPSHGGISRGPPLPLYLEDRFNNFSLPSSPQSHSQPRLPGSHMPYPPRFPNTNLMLPPIPHGSPDAFNSSMLLQNMPPLQRRGSGGLHQPHPSSSRSPAQTVYPYATYIQPPQHQPQYPSNAPSRAGPSHPPSHPPSPEFPQLHQLPRY